MNVDRAAPPGPPGRVECAGPRFTRPTFSVSRNCPPEHWGVHEKEDGVNDASNRMLSCVEWLMTARGATGERKGWV